MPSSEEIAQVVLNHITEIANGRCSLTEDDIAAQDHPLAGELLAGLMMLSEELELRERERAAAEHERAEAERRNLELSTPVLELGHQVVLMPLVGIVDLARSDQMVERALAAVADKRARVLVIDVTGVGSLNAGVAARLLSTMRAVGLLGARTILTGVSPANAQSLVDLDISLEGVLLERSLGDGLEAAFAITRKTS